MQRLTYNTVKATKEEVNAPAQYSRAPGHQVHREASLALSTAAFLPSPPWALGCCSQCRVKKKKMVSHSPHLPVHLRQKQALHWKERKGKNPYYDQKGKRYLKTMPLLSKSGFPVMELKKLL